MSKLNVFDKNTYYPWGYIGNWGKNVKAFFRNLKYAHQRITRGYCDRDLWDLSEFYLNMLHVTLRDLAERHMGYPGIAPYETNEKWTEALYDMSIKFYQANEENEYFPTPMLDKWYKDFEENGKGDIVEYDSPYANEMYLEMQKNDEKRSAAFNEAWTTLGQVFWQLWD